MKRWVVIEEGRVLASHLTPYKEASRRYYRWRWLAVMLNPPGSRVMRDRDTGQWWILSVRIERVAEG